MRINARVLAAGGTGAALGSGAPVAPRARSQRRRGGREHLLGRRHTRPPRHGVTLLPETLLQGGEDEQDIAYLTRVAHQPDAPDLPLEIAQPDSTGFSGNKLSH